MSFASSSLLHAYTTHMMRVQNVTNAFSNPCPLTFHWVARTLTVAYGGSNLASVELRAAGLLILKQTFFAQPAGPSFVSVTGYWVIDAGEQFNVKSLTLGEGVDCYISGYQLLA